MTGLLDQQNLKKRAWGAAISDGLMAYGGYKPFASAALAQQVPGLLAQQDTARLGAQLRGGIAGLLSSGQIDAPTAHMWNQIPPETLLEILGQNYAPYTLSENQQRFAGFNPNPVAQGFRSPIVVGRDVLDRDTMELLHRSPEGAGVQVNVGGEGPKYEIGTPPADYRVAYDATGKPTHFELVPGSATQQNLLRDQTQAMAEAQTALDVIDAMLSHDALGLVTGRSGAVTRALPGAAMPGVTDFLSYEDQLKGKMFMQAYQTLKGGGQITEVEGRKATDAMARISRPGLSKEDYTKALNELREVIAAGHERARRGVQQYGGQSQEPSGLPVRHWNPQTGRVE